MQKLEDLNRWALLSGRKGCWRVVPSPECTAIAKLCVRDVEAGAQAIADFVAEVNLGEKSVAVEWFPDDSVSAERCADVEVRPKESVYAEKRVRFSAFVYSEGEYTLEFQSVYQSPLSIGRLKPMFFLFKVVLSNNDKYPAGTQCEFRLNPGEAGDYSEIVGMYLSPTRQFQLSVKEKTVPVTQVKYFHVNWELIPKHIPSRPPSSGHLIVQGEYTLEFLSAQVRQLSPENILRVFFTFKVLSTSASLEYPVGSTCIVMDDGSLAGIELSQSSKLQVSVTREPGAAHVRYVWKVVEEVYSDA